MKRWKGIYRSALTAGLYLFLSCSFNRQNSFELIFPFHNKIYGYHSSGNTVTVKKTTEYLFSKYYYKAGKYHWFSGSIPGSNRNILVEYNAENNNIKEILTGHYSKIIPLDGYVITVSGEFNKDKGFLYEFLSLDEKRFNYRKLYSLYLDLMISDVEIKSGNIYMAGYDNLDENNLIILVRPQAQEMQILVEEKRGRNFFKLIQTKRELVYYLSNQDWQEGVEIEFRRFSYSESEPFENVRGVDLPAGNYVPYGKGFYENGYIFLPVLDKEYNTGLLKSSSPDSFFPFTCYPLPVGIYAFLAADADFLYFLGYNYYKEKNKFYLLNLPRSLSEQNLKDIRYFLLDSGNDQ